MKKRYASSNQDIDRIIKGEHPCPHAFLGNHRIADNGHESDCDPRVSARGGTGLPGHQRRDAPGLPMEKIHGDGLYEIILRERSDFFPYKLQGRRDHDVTCSDDPYRFLPTITDFHLDSLQGRDYHHAYQKLGAHHKRYVDSDGFAFAVWAPNARQVSVVGDFNGWDYRTHPMRSMGSSGIWEIFIPGVTEGALYKYAVLGCDGRRIEKTDPYAFAKELRPKTASIMWDLDRYCWRDREWMQSRL